MKKKKILLIVIVLLLLAVLSLLLVVFKYDKKCVVSFDTDGGSIIDKIEVSKNERLVLPKDPIKDGYIFGGFRLENGKIATNETIIVKDTTLKAIWISNKEKIITMTFELPSGTKIKLNMIRGKKLESIDTTQKDGYTFAGWMLDGEKIVDENTIFDESANLKPRWIKNDVNKVKIIFNSEGGTTINDIIIGSGDKIVLPVDPVKEGYVFKGWILSNGTTVTKDSVVSSDTTITAVWKEAYTCPSNCTVSVDGKTCTRTLTANIINKNTCASGSTLKNGKCLNYSRKYHADNSNGWHCNNSNDYMYSETDGTGGAFMWCVPTTALSKANTCPNGYKIKDNKCVKTETVNCTKN